MSISFSPLARGWIDTPPNRVAVALDQARRGHREFIDLINATPQENGLVFPYAVLREIVHRALADPAVQSYQPDPRGHRPAREAVAAFYHRRAAPADPDRILLTPGTSQAYFYALRLLTEPGDDILIPSPGYPLFDDLSALCGVRIRKYHLAEHSGSWRPDVEEIAFQCTPRTRAIMVVSPHNPTGAVFSADDFDALATLCRRRSLAVVFDEVFSEFLAPPLDLLPRPAPEAFPLVVTLNGFSKMFALPGWKVGWMKADGDPATVDRMFKALEFLSDVFLPLSDLTQAMIPDLLARGDPEVCGALAREYSERRNLALQTARFPLRSPQGGVYLCARLPETVCDDETFVLRALADSGVFVHPGYYYDLPQGHFVFTCVSLPERLDAGIERLNQTLS